MKESDLYVPVRDWLRARGYTVHIEVFDCDVVGVKDGHIVAVELKTGMRSELYGQLCDRARWADEVWAAVPASARLPGPSWSSHGFGLLILMNGKVKEQRKARPQPWFRHRTRAYRLKELASRLPAHDEHVAGLPSCRQAKLQRDAVRYPPKTVAAEAAISG